MGKLSCTHGNTKTRCWMFHPDAIFRCWIPNAMYMEMDLKKLKFNIILLYRVCITKFKMERQIFWCA